MKWPSYATAITFLTLGVVFVMSLPFLTSVDAELDAETGLECIDSSDQCPFWAATVRIVVV
jgi:hypothetical protein